MKSTALDIMHVAYQGEAKFELTVFLFYCKSKGWFTLQSLNTWMRKDKNWPEDVPQSRRVRRVRLTGGKVRLGAAEVKTVFSILPRFLRSTGIVPMDGSDIPTMSFLLHHDILESVCGVQGVDEKGLVFLETLIKLWKSFFSVAYGWVRPKTHDYMHFVQSVRLFGNMRSYWTFGYESYHKVVKRLYHAGNKKSGFEKWVLEDLYFHFMQLNMNIQAGRKA
jgi:hypothetical protein